MGGHSTPGSPARVVGTMLWVTKSFSVNFLTLASLLAIGALLSNGGKANGSRVSVKQTGLLCSWAGWACTEGDPWKEKIVDEKGIRIEVVKALLTMKEPNRKGTGKPFEDHWGKEKKDIMGETTNPGKKTDHHIMTWVDIGNHVRAIGSEIENQKDKPEVQDRMYEEVQSSLNTLMGISSDPQAPTSRNKKLTWVKALEGVKDTADKEEPNFVSNVASEIDLMLRWTPGNLVYGPESSQRFKDPGEYIDTPVWKSLRKDDRQKFKFPDQCQAGDFIKGKTRFTLTQLQEEANKATEAAKSNLEEYKFASAVNKGCVPKFSYDIETPGGWYTILEYLRDVDETGIHGPAWKSFKVTNDKKKNGEWYTMLEGAEEAGEAGEYGADIKRICYADIISGVNYEKCGKKLHNIDFATGKLTCLHDGKNFKVPDEDVDNQHPSLCP